MEIPVRGFLIVFRYSLTSRQTAETDSVEFHLAAAVRHLALATLIANLAAAAQAADNYSVDPVHSTISFMIEHGNERSQISKSSLKPQEVGTEVGTDADAGSVRPGPAGQSQSP